MSDRERAILNILIRYLRTEIPEDEVLDLVMMLFTNAEWDTVSPD